MVCGAEGKRRRKFRAGKMCARCGIREADDVHHDLEKDHPDYRTAIHPICKPCHRGVHKIYPNQAVPLADVMEREARGEIVVVPIFDAAS